MEFQGTIAATSALSDNIASKKKKKRGVERRGSSLHFSLDGELFCKKSQETSNQFPWSGLEHVPLPQIVKRNMLQGSYTFSLFSGRRDSPAKKGMINTHGKAGNTVCPYPLPSVPTPHCSRQPQSTSVPKGVTRYEFYS